MSLLTLYRDGKEFTLERVDTLREMLDRHLIDPTDLVRPGDGQEPLTVAELLAQSDVTPPGDEQQRPSTPAGEDPWNAWEDVDEVPVDDLVSRLLEGVAEEDPELDSEPAPEPAVRPTSEPTTGRYVLAGDGAVPAPDPSPPTPPRPASPPSPPSPPAPSEKPPGTPGAMPRSFVEYVQQQGSVASNLELHEQTSKLVPGGRRRVPFGFWAAVVGAAVALVAFSWYGVVRIGAEKTYPTVSDVLGNDGQEPTEPPETDNGSQVGGDPSIGGIVRTEDRYRAQIPVGLRSFRNTEDLKDALFTDIMNAGAPVRTVRLEAVVVSPEERPEHRRPEEVNVEILLSPEDQDGSEEAVAKAGLVLGHYAAKAHLHFQEVVIQTRFDGGVGTAYRTRGEGVVAFYERETDLRGFMASLERIPQGDYVMNGDD